MRKLSDESVEKNLTQREKHTSPLPLLKANKLNTLSLSVHDDDIFLFYSFCDGRANLLFIVRMATEKILTESVGGNSIDRKVYDHFKGKWAKKMKGKRDRNLLVQLKSFGVLVMSGKSVL